MKKYRLRMKTPSGRGVEYVTVYATSNFERYLLEHDLKYTRDIIQDYQLTTKFNEIEQENKQIKEIIRKWNNMTNAGVFELEDLLEEIENIVFKPKILKGDSNEQN